MLVVGSVLGLLLWLFAPALVGSSSFVFRDAAHFYHPLFELMRSEWGAGRMPLWNPYDNTGVSLVAENTASVFYPGKLLFALPLDYTLLYNVYIVAHVALAAAGGFWLARHWGASVLAAGLAAVSYAFSGNVLFQYCNVVFLIGAAWLPWSMLLADRMLSERRWQSAIGLGAVLAMMVLGGDPQMAYNAALLAALYALILWRSRNRGGTDEACRSLATDAVSRGSQGILDTSPKRKRGFFILRPSLALRASIGKLRTRSLGHPIPAVHLLAIAGGTCLLLGAVQIIPSWQASRASVRGAYESPRNIYELAASFADSRAGGNEPTAPWYAGLLDVDPAVHERQIYPFSVGPWREIEFVWPNISGRQFPTNRRWLNALPAEGRVWTPSMYMGLLPLLLAAASWSVRRAAPPHVRWMSWSVLLAALGSMGVYGLAWMVREIATLRGGGDALGVGDQVGGLYWLMTVLLPGYVYFRYPAKLLVVASLGLSVLAAQDGTNRGSGRALPCAVGWRCCWAEAC